jgi:hypothetical protein
MWIEILRLIRVKSGYFGQRRVGLIALRLDFAWTEITDLKIRYLAYELAVRWPRTLKFRLDLAQYRMGGRLDEHIDPTHELERQFNFVFVLRKPIKGGELVSEKFVYNGSRLKIVETNRYRHEVTRVEKGERIVANLGVRFANQYLNPPPF